MFNFEVWIHENADQLKEELAQSDLLDLHPPTEKSKKKPAPKAA